MALDINFGLLNAPNPLLQYAEGVETGRQRRRQDDNDAFVRQRQTQQDQLNYDEHLAKMDDRQRAEAAARAEKLAGLALSVKQAPPEQRKGAVQTLAPQLAAYGFTPEQLASFEPTDANLDSIINEGMSLKDRLTAYQKQNEPYTLAPGSARYVGDKKLTEQPFAPQYRSVGEGQTLVEIPPPGGGQPAATGGDWTADVAAAAPDAQVTSGYRTPAHNAEVGGAAHSRHMTGEAVDLVPRPGETMAQLYARVRGVPGTRAINEGDHVHVQVDGGRPAGGARVIATGAPKPQKGQPRPATAAEKAAYGVAADVPAKIDENGNFSVISGVGAGLKRVPAAVQSGYVANKSSISQIDQAIRDIQENPNALGLLNLLPEGVTQRVDPNGVRTRAPVANIGSLLVHDRSGAAVTASETPRLKPFIPSVTDSPKAAIAKLQSLKQQLMNNNTEIEVQFGEDSGYQPISGGAPPPAAGRGSGGTKTTSPPAGSLKEGHVTTFANGQSWTLRGGKPQRVR